ncbi:MAG: hypothetical protein JO157_17180 [Acetobacteraceae bacterium]|nr:hypothetical protein [Acetobacteraceae bacterium]
MKQASRRAALLVVVLAVPGCQYFQRDAGLRSGASAADIAACRKRADQIFEMQNRGAVYDADIRSTNTRDSPFATSGLPGVTTEGLGAQYQRDEFEDSCLRSTNSSAPGNAPAAIAPAPIAPAPIAPGGPPGQGGAARASH